ncbi:hypothetical protein [Parachlamydia acanthamoebae]|uniref:hypothetical protein n=1 Tax=Parachlamydia acanthamoebae TaxID=83552 RepID=UPI0002F672C3|nr:hypothetical protein [Parachlamydia acanthamoebae]
MEKIRTIHANLSELLNSKAPVSEKDTNDIIRLYQLLTANTRIHLSETISPKIFA